MRRLKADDLKQLSDEELRELRRTITTRTLIKAVIILVLSSLFFVAILSLDSVLLAANMTFIFFATLLYVLRQV